VAERLRGARDRGLFLQPEPLHRSLPRRRIGLSRGPCRAQHCAAGFLTSSESRKSVGVALIFIAAGSGPTMSFVGVAPFATTVGGQRSMRRLGRPQPGRVSCRQRGAGLQARHRLQKPPPLAACAAPARRESARECGLTLRGGRGRPRQQHWRTPISL
jgi:hypothetical protein